MEDEMLFRVLGPVEARWRGRSLPIGGAKRRSVLAAFLLQPGELVPLDEIVHVVWGPEASSTLRNAAQAHISRLRKTLSLTPGVQISARSVGYVLQADPECIDLHRFRRLVREARASRTARGAALLYRSALELWPDQPLADIDSPWLSRRFGTVLEEERFAAVDGWVEAELQLHGYDAIVARLTGLVAAHPLRETFREQLITALYGTGRKAEALAAYQQARHYLAEELGVEPGERLRKVFESILCVDRR
ncbi:AfsR/SARP family transcriptional regulator [Nonomuraea sp. NPDC003804]|uniref:AfsR/SARP family transcriptional regulator n=1 Tax=Nonomuraea sp. NPDC003804 TaxID=3154547 RepID=UPI0033B2200B